MADKKLRKELKALEAKLDKAVNELEVARAEFVVAKEAFVKGRVNIVAPAKRSYTRRVEPVAIAKKSATKTSGAKKVVAKKAPAKKAVAKKAVAKKSSGHSYGEGRAGRGPGMGRG
jgi:hypothetical protein